MIFGQRTCSCPQLFSRTQEICYQSPKNPSAGMNGATRVFAFITHGLFSGPAVERIAASQLELVVSTNSIVPLTEESVSKCPKIRRVSIAPLLSAAIAAIQVGQSRQSRLFVMVMLPV